MPVLARVTCTLRQWLSGKQLILSQVVAVSMLCLSDLAYSHLLADTSDCLGMWEASGVGQQGFQKLLSYMSIGQINCVRTGFRLMALSGSSGR